MDLNNLTQWKQSTPELVKILKKVKPFTMLTEDRLCATYHAVNYAVNNKIEGDIIECGVWKGGCAMLMAEALKHYEDIEKNIWLYDTFTGMAKPSAEDINLTTGKCAIEEYNLKQQDSYNTWCYASLDEVKTNVLSTGLSAERIKFISGKVEKTIPASLPDKIAVLRLDTDWYESTIHEMIHMYPRLSEGGVLLVDDYGSWAGSKKAVDEYLKKERINIFLVPIGASVLGIKNI